MEKNNQECSLESVFEELDGVVAHMEDKDISLEETFRLYHKGMDLLKTCNEKLDLIEKQIRMLDEDGGEHEF